MNPRKSGVGIDLLQELHLEKLFSFNLPQLQQSVFGELATIVKCKFAWSKQPAHTASEDARVRETNVAIKNAALPDKQIQRRYATDKATNTSQIISPCLFTFVTGKMLFF